MFADLHGYHAVGVWAGSLVALKSCDFLFNTILPFDKGSAVIQVDSYDDAFRDTAVRLEDCTFNITSSETPVLLLDNREDEVQEAVIYSDSSFPPVCIYEGKNQSSAPPACIMAQPSPLSQADDVFISPSSDWLVQVQQVRTNSFREIVGDFHVASQTASHHISS